MPSVVASPTRVASSAPVDRDQQDEPVVQDEQRAVSSSDTRQRRAHQRPELTGCTARAPSGPSPARIAWHRWPQIAGRSRHSDRLVRIALIPAPASGSPRLRGCPSATARSRSSSACRIARLRGRARSGPRTATASSRRRSGTPSAPGIGTLTPTMPALTLLLNARAASPSRVKMAVPLPYSCSLTSCSAASKSGTRTTDEHRPEDLLLVDPHRRRDAVEQASAPRKKPVGLQRRHAAVHDELGAFLDAEIDVAADPCRGASGHERPHLGAGLVAGRDLQPPSLRLDAAPSARRRAGRRRPPPPRWPCTAHPPTRRRPRSARRRPGRDRRPASRPCGSWRRRAPAPACRWRCRVE